MSIFKKDSVQSICDDLTKRLERIEQEQQVEVDKAIADVHEAKGRLSAATQEQQRASKAIDKIRNLFA